MANHMGYVKNEIVVFFQKFELCLRMINQVFSNFIRVKKCGKYDYLFIAEKKS
jgi:hypothetical protein